MPGRADLSRLWLFIGAPYDEVSNGLIQGSGGEIFPEIMLQMRQSNPGRNEVTRSFLREHSRFLTNAAEPAPTRAFR